MIRLERALRRDADIFRLLVAERGELDADLVEMQPRDLLVEMLGQRVDLLLVLARIGPQLELRDPTSPLQREVINTDSDPP